MTQYKKDEVKERIDTAALGVFAQKGFIAAKVADISKRSGVSVGNIYRYYRNKDEIFYSVVPEEFPVQLLDAISNKIGSAKSGLEAGSAAFEQVTAEYIGFMMKHRERLKILISGCRGTRYERTKSELAAEMITQIKRIYGEAYALFVNRYGNDDMLNLIYVNLIDAYGYILGCEGSDEELINMIQQVNLYHFSGITNLINI